MKSLATFAIKHRWWVIAGWFAFILLAQGISGALGGANYKDTFSLPRTETASRLVFGRAARTGGIRPFVDCNRN